MAEGGGGNDDLQRAIEAARPARLRRIEGKKDLRVVLLGNVGSGKSAAGNTLLGSSVFLSRLSDTPVTLQCEAHIKTLKGRQIMVVDTPGLTPTVDWSTVKKCLQLSAPGPDIFLLVISLERRFTQEEKDTVKRAVEMFGKKLYRFSIVLFTFKDNLKGTPIETYVSRAGKDLRQLVQDCGDRFHAFNNKNPGEENQVEQLLMKIDDLVEKKSYETFGVASTDVIKDFITRLNLSHFYRQKLTVAEVLSISRVTLQREEPQTEKDLASSYLNKLFSLDYRARYLTVPKQGVMGKMEGTSDEDFYYFLNKEEEFNDSDEGTTIHPMDVQMAVFHCADSFLRQEMMTKLSSCQYALPLLVPIPLTSDIELPLWSFQKIKKTWNTVGGSSKTLPVCQLKTPMVFFCRLGSVSTSKSQLLNSVINPKHDTFFHRDSPGSSRSRQFVEGLVEISWYCPAGNSDDHFSECIAFSNLRGDAAEHKEQSDFLSEQAAVNVVLMQNVKYDDNCKELLLKLHHSAKPLICLMSEQRGTSTMGSELNLKCKIGLKDRNRAELQKELIATIKMCFQNCKSAPTFSLEESKARTKHYGFRVDEDSEDCQVGKTAALKVMNLLKGEDVPQIKAKFLPISQNMTYRHELVSGSFSMLRPTIGDQHRNSSLNELMKAVVELLNSKSLTQKMYSVKWLELYLMQQQKDTCDFRSEFLGLEHIVREMGQIYETWAECPDKMTAEIRALPALAADFLISGHPLELMAGDVPLTWVKSVLDKVTEKLGEQRVFVLSVLGLQSSGKSTMLNTMFGVQFAVSSGRCTKGAFMQLVRVKEEVKDELEFDFLLVVNVQWLHPLNYQLGFFGTAFSNMTLINIEDETPEERGVMPLIPFFHRFHSEVQQAHSFVLVHQNVTDISARKRSRITEILTQLSRLNIERDVHYVSQLWEGSPPMAPPNPAYSENIQRLKQAILSAAAKKKTLTFSELKVHINRAKEHWERRARHPLSPFLFF